MAKNAGRKKRWRELDAKTHTSALGRAVYEKGAWWGLMDFTVQTAGVGETLLVEEAHSRRLGPHKRPRDAMVAIEREAVALTNRHGDGVRFIASP